jgi:hypothetical protein
VVEDLDVQAGGPEESPARHWGWISPRPDASRRHSTAQEGAGTSRPGRRLRWETVATVVSVVVIAGVLLRPWEGGPFAARAQPSETPATAAAPTEDVAAATFEGINLVGVDWSGLATPDPHTGWGVASATLSLPPGATDVSQGVTTTATWTALETARSGSEVTITIPVLPGRQIFALAVTWPARVSADTIIFTYDAPDPSQPGDAQLFGFNPKSELTVISADQATSADPVVQSEPARTGPVVSGEFWVGPFDQIALPSFSPMAELWRGGPWWWPAGQYRITVSSKTGIQTILVRLAAQS